MAADLISRDASAAGLIALSAPAVLAAGPRGRPGDHHAELSRRVARLPRVLPPAAATTTWATVTFMLALLTVLLDHASHRHHHLTAELHRLAAVDSLTGLVTRRVLDGAMTAPLRGSTASRATAR